MDIEDKIIAKLTDIDENVKTLVIRQNRLKTSVHNLNNRVEGFVKLHETLDCEVAALRQKVDRVEDRVLVLEKTA